MGPLQNKVNLLLQEVDLRYARFVAAEEERTDATEEWGSREADALALHHDIAHGVLQRVGAAQQLRARFIRDREVQHPEHECRAVEQRHDVYRSGGCGKGWVDDDSPTSGGSGSVAQRQRLEGPLRVGRSLQRCRRQHRPRTARLQQRQACEQRQLPPGTAIDGK